MGEVLVAGMQHWEGQSCCILSWTWAGMDGHAVGIVLVVCVLIGWGVSSRKNYRKTTRLN
jgi:hypothetical protein